MELNKGHIIFGAVCLVAGIVLGAGFRSCSSKPAEPALRPEVIHDTITVHDTLRIKEHTKPREVVKIDTIFLQGENDTIAVPIPITAYEYRDTFVTDTSRIELGIRYEGYRAKIDGIDLKSQYTIQPRTIVKKKGWGQFIGIGVGAGYGASVVGNQVFAAPQVGISIVYGFGYHL